MSIKLAYRITDEDATYYRCDKCGDLLYRMLGDPLAGRYDVHFGGSEQFRSPIAWRHCPFCGEPLFAWVDRGTVAERDSAIERLWEELSDIPFDDHNDGDMTLSESWLHFPAGTEREKIWHWFDERHSKGVAYLLNNSASSQTGYVEYHHTTLSEMKGGNDLE